MNRDTVYSGAIVDISEGAPLTVPDSGGRCMSVMVVNEDQYLNRVIHEPGEHTLSADVFGTLFVNLLVRTLVDASDPDDIQEANALQDQVQIESVSGGLANLELLAVAWPASSEGLSFHNSGLRKA